MFIFWELKSNVTIFTYVIMYNSFNKKEYGSNKKGYKNVCFINHIYNEMIKIYISNIDEQVYKILVRL